MPEWVQHGLDELLSHSSAKGSKLRFYADEWSRDEMREAVREGRIIAPKELITMTRTELWARDGSSFWGALQQAESFVYFLMAGDGSKNAKYRDIIPRYITALQIAVDELKKKADAEAGESSGEASTTPATEEEEEERFRKRRESLRDSEKDLILDVFQRTFHTWSEDDWKKLERDYFKSIS